MRNAFIDWFRMKDRIAGEQCACSSTTPSILIDDFIPTLHYSLLMSELNEEFWKHMIRITCEEKHGKCRHELGDTYVYKHALDYPVGLCSGIQEPARINVMACQAGVPSWEADDKSIYRIHCMSKKGTVWRIERIPPIQET